MTASIERLVFDLGGLLVDVVCADVTVARLARRSDTPADQLAEPLGERFAEQPLSLAEQFHAGALDAAGRQALPFDGAAQLTRDLARLGLQDVAAA